MKRKILAFALALSVFIFSGSSVYALGVSDYNNTPAYQFAKLYDNVLKFMQDCGTSTTDWVCNTIDNTNRIVDSLLGRSVKYNTRTTNPSPRVDTTSYSSTVYNDNSQTSYYKAISYNNTNNTFSVYSPTNNNYNTTNELYYSPSFDAYYYTTTVNEQTYYNYVYEGDTYVTYIVDVPENPNENRYFEVYFELPDGRNSFNLSAEDVHGEYFIYDIILYDYVPEDDGVTLGLWHLDGDLSNCSVNGGLLGSSSSATYKNAYFEGGKFLNALNDYLYLYANGTLPSSYTLEFIAYVEDFSPFHSKNTVYSNSGSFTSWYEYIAEPLLQTRAI